MAMGDILCRVIFSFISRFLINSSINFFCDCVLMCGSFLVAIGNRHCLVVGFVPQYNLLSANLLFHLFLLLSPFSIHGDLLLLGLLLLWNCIINNRGLFVIVSVTCCPVISCWHCMLL